MRTDFLNLPAPQWVISDTHLGHSNILQYCPWRTTWAGDLAEHDRRIIEAWRAVVAPEDIVLHLGDFALGERGRLVELRRALPGRICLVRGNHDRSTTAMCEAGFDWVCSAVRIVAESQQWLGRHNPAAFTLHEAETSVRLLHGHTHGNGYQNDTSTIVRAKARDCSLDAVRSVGPVAWADIR